MTQTAEPRISLREKFRIKPFEWWELKPIEFSGFKFFWGTYKTFSLLSALTQMSPLLNFLNQAVRGFPYRHYSLVIDESAFTFSDGKGCAYTPQIIDGGKP
jgi:hypothetical protein